MHSCFLCKDAHTSRFSKSSSKDENTEALPSFITFQLSALLFSHCSPFLERFGLCRDGGLLGMTVGQSSRRGRGCGGSLVALRVFSDSKDTELRTLEMTLPLCHVKTVRRHRGTEVRFASLLERCRASFLSIRF